MTTLYQMALEVTNQLEKRHASDPIGLIRAKGTLATKTGFLVALISPTDHDDPEKAQLLRSAAAELGITI